MLFIYKTYVFFKLKSSFCIHVKKKIFLRNRFTEVLGTSLYHIRLKVKYIAQ